jgi:NADH dehydrogenase [ubiquinone] 1 alpha subcomplex assembly factor 6
MSKPRLSFCAEQVRRFDNDRFLCSLFAPAAEREALAAVFAFNVEVARIRESVAEPLLGQIRLQWWRDAIEGIYAGRAQSHQVVVALDQAVHGFGLSRRHFERVLDARAFDLDDAPPTDLAALIDYADATSATLSALSLEVLGADGAGVCEAARGVGIAWALVGLIRAVPFHARARRLYLPADLNRKAGLDVYQLFDRGNADGLSRVAGMIADTAGDYLSSARSRRREVPAQALPALLPATLAEGYLRQLRTCGFDPFDARVQTASPLRHLRIGYNRLRGRY